MNDISKSRLAFIKEKSKSFTHDENVIAAIVTGSVARGTADDNSDIDTILFLKDACPQERFNQIIDGAKESGGDLYHGTPETGFAVYYYFDGVKCDFGFGPASDTEKLLDEMIANPEVDLVKHLQISGFHEGIVLKDNEWIKKQFQKLSVFPQGLDEMMVKHFLKFHPKWVLEKMGVDRNETIFLYESFIESIGNIIGILCGLNKMYHPGKLKGIESALLKMKIKPQHFSERYRKIFDDKNENGIDELYSLINETIQLVERYLPEVNTERTKKIIEMKLRMRNEF